MATLSPDGAPLKLQNLTGIMQQFLDVGWMTANVQVFGYLPFADARDHARGRCPKTSKEGNRESEGRWRRFRRLWGFESRHGGLVNDRRGDGGRFRGGWRVVRAVAVDNRPAHAIGRMTAFQITGSWFGSGPSQNHPTRPSARVVVNGSFGSNRQTETNDHVIGMSAIYPEAGLPTIALANHQLSTRRPHCVGLFQ
jgi:hypothetical protein